MQDRIGRFFRQLLTSPKTLQKRPLPSSAFPNVYYHLIPNSETYVFTFQIDYVRNEILIATFMTLTVHELISRRGDLAAIVDESIRDYLSSESA